MKTLVGFVVRLVLFVVFVNALLVLAGWLFGPLAAHWLASSFALALNMFVWLLPFAALTLFFVLLLEPFPTTHEQ